MRIAFHKKESNRTFEGKTLKKYSTLMAMGLLIMLMVLATWWIDQRQELRIPLKDGYLFGDLLHSDGPSGKVLFVLIAGSGPTDRDGNSEILGGKNDSLKALAYGLKEAGYSSFRYDQRSAGKTRRQTTSDLRTITFEVMVEDLVNVIQAMKSKEKFDTIILVGHSQGALVATLAAQKESVSGCVSLCGPTRPVDQVLMWQLQQQNPPELQEMKSVIESLKQGRMVEDMGPETEKLLGTSVQPFLISWMAYDPSLEIKKLTIPLCFIFGSEDLQVPSSEKEYLLELPEGDSSQVIIGMNHVLKHVKSGDRKDNLASYVDPSFRLHEGLVTAIAAFAKGVR